MVMTKDEKRVWREQHCAKVCLNRFEKCGECYRHMKWTLRPDYRRGDGKKR